MSQIDNYYRSAVVYTQSPPETNTVSSNFNYSKIENQYGSDILLYTGLIPSTNPLTGAEDGDKYAVDGIDILEKVANQQLTAVQGSAFGFTDSRLTYLIAQGSQYSITVWSKDAVGAYTVAVPSIYYDIFYYPPTDSYAIYFKDTSYEPMYRTQDGLIGLQYVPQVTCYRYCGPKGIENLPAGGGGGGLAGTNYIYVAANGTDTQNAAELQASYNTAKTLSPTSTNRITIVAGPGLYNFGASANFVMDTDFIDLVSLDGNRSVIFNFDDTENTGFGTISITAANVFVKGVDVLNKNFTIAPYLYDLNLENCAGGDYSFGGADPEANPRPAPVDIYGTFTNCKGGFRSFGTNNNLWGRYTDCVDAGQGFGAYGLCKYESFFERCGTDSDGFGPSEQGATFISCYGTSAAGTFNSAFSGFDYDENGQTVVRDLAGTYIGCFGGDGSFTGNLTGQFINCIGGNGSFTADAQTLSGTFINCSAGQESFGNGTLSGTFTNCTSGPYSFGYGYNETASGTFTNCTGGDWSFGSTNTSGSTASGTFTNCSAGEYSFGYNGTASGIFTGCVGDDGSFGGSGYGGTGYLTGKLKHCTLTAGTFQTPTDGGKIILCIDGNDDIVNATSVPIP
jgi:hypothetical protein